jgi:GntR family transcriptional regulator/MocR family aminotransferase
VNRNTVIAAYDELTGEGWIESTRARGSFVSRSLPEVRPKAFTRSVASRKEVPGATGFDFQAAGQREPERPARAPAFAVSLGAPDVRLTPVDLLARAYRRAIRRQTESVLKYGHTGGHPALREALASMLAATRGLATSAEDVLITSGSQMALELLGRTLLRKGDVVAVEQIGYRPAWNAFQQHGAKVVPIPVDSGGMDLEALARLVQRTPVRAVYVTPHHQYPTTATLTAGRRIALLELARKLRIAIIEDDYDHEYHYEGRPILPLASVDSAGVVIYIGTLTKVIAPGVRLGYTAAPRPLLESMAAHRHVIDRQGDHALEYAVAELIADGAVQRHARRARRVYQARRDSLVRLLRSGFADTLSFNVPAGGIAVWARAADGIDVDAWGDRAARQGVAILTAKYYAFDGRPRPFIRLGFASLTEEEMSEALARLKRAL